MKIIVFADLHGNLSALKKLIKTTDFKNADKRIFLGDVAFGFSRPNKCIKILNKTCDCIIGNNDCYICDHIPDVDMEEFAKSKLLQWEYWLKNVSNKSKKIMKSWPREITLGIDNYKLFFTHYPWEEYQNDINVVDTPEIKNLKSRQKLFKGNNADYIFFGHEHYTNSFTYKKQTFCCVGSCGLFLTGSYIIIEIKNEKISITEKSINNDIDYELTLTEKAGYPLEIPK